MTPEVSVVIPLRDEALSVVPLHHELAAVLQKMAVPYEIILIDDGSQDATFERLRQIQAHDPLVRVIQFTRNCGQTAAFAAGFAAAEGRFIITADGDLQNDPADIPAMLTLARNHDIVSGWRRRRKDALLTRHVPSVIANWLLGLVTGVRLHDYGCSLKVYRAEVVKPLRLRPGLHRYLPALAGQLGNRITEVVVNHRPRQHGRSKYGLSRTFAVVRDIVTIRRLMREAIDSTAAPPRLYEIRQILQSPGRSRV